VPVNRCFEIVEKVYAILKQKSKHNFTSKHTERKGILPVIGSDSARTQDFF
jgi:hypothetical protein